MNFKLGDFPKHGQKENTKHVFLGRQTKQAIKFYFKSILLVESK